MEKEILRQIAAVKKLKTLNDEAAIAEKAIKDKKVCRHYLDLCNSKTQITFNFM